MVAKTETRNVPAAALRFEAGRCEFGEVAEGSANVPVRIVARSGQPVDHWYWGKIVHDLDGMRLHKKSLPVDYAHFDDEVLGYLDRFETGSGALVVAGELVPYGDADRAGEVIHKAQNGVPYEASIFFSGPLRLEELAEGTEAEVNGYTLQGPALIVRQWNLRGVAICPYGMDRNTQTQLTDGGERVAVQVTITEALTMSEANEGNGTPAADAQRTSDGGQLAERVDGAGQVDGGQLAEGKGKATPPPLPSKAKEGGDDPRAECKRFLDAFGPQGATWWAEGKTFGEAQALHTEALTAENADLRAKLSGVDRGEAEAVTATPDGEGSKLSETDRTNFGGLAALVAQNRAAMGAGLN